MKSDSFDVIVVSPILETSLPGVFAAGDSIAKRYRQITTAVADGTVAALTAMEYIRKNAVPQPAEEIVETLS